MNNSNGPALYDFLKCVQYPLGDKTQFTVGRNENCCLDIISKYISRNQCIIKLNEEKEWIIKDLSSFKTTQVNGKKVNDNCQVLKDGDRISFLNYKDSEFIFQKNSLIDDPLSKKRKLSVNEVVAVESSDEDEPPDKKPCRNDMLDKLKAENYSLTADRDRLFVENNSLNEKYLQVCKMLEETQKSLESLEADKTKLALKLVDESATKSDMVIQMQNYIDQLKECEIELDRLANEKKANKEDVPKSKITDCVEFNQMKEDLENTRKQLLAKEERLNEALAEKDVLYNNISGLLEDELTCSVCSDVLFQVISLDCRHSFCAKCLATWKLTKRECPVCRTKIKSEVNPLILDNFIDKLTDVIGGEFKKRRQVVREERASSNGQGNRVSPFRYATHNRRGRRRRSFTGNTFVSRRTVLGSVVAELVNHLDGISRLSNGPSPTVMIDLTDSHARR